MDQFSKDYYYEGESRDFLTWEEQELRIDAVIQHEAEIRDELAFLPKWPEVKAIYGRLGSPLTAREIGINDGQLLDALVYGKDYRDRYTVAKTADELGILDEMVKKVLVG
jgi:glycerol-1-phosphate dehydrogenase [NAD(P)+]